MFLYANLVATLGKAVYGPTWLKVQVKSAPDMQKLTHQCTLSNKIENNYPRAQVVKEGLYFSQGFVDPIPSGRAL